MGAGATENATTEGKYKEARTWQLDVDKIEFTAVSANYVVWREE